MVLLPQEKKRRREENLKRRLENERKAEIVQVVSPMCQLGTALEHPTTSNPHGSASSLLQFLSLPLSLEGPGRTGRFPVKLGMLEACPLCSPKLGNTRTQG